MVTDIHSTTLPFTTDSVIAWGERTCFTNLRCRFLQVENKKTKTPDKKHVAADKKVLEAIEPITLSHAGSDDETELTQWNTLGALVTALPASLSPRDIETKIDPAHGPSARSHALEASRLPTSIMHEGLLPSPLLPPSLPRLPSLPPSLPLLLSPFQ